MILFKVAHIELSAKRIFDCFDLSGGGSYD